MCPLLVLIGDEDVNSWPLFSLPYVICVIGLSWSIVKITLLIYFYKALRWLLVVVQRA